MANTPAAKARLKAAAYNQPIVGDVPIAFVVVGKVGGHKDLPKLIKPMFDSGYIDQAVFNG